MAPHFTGSHVLAGRGGFYRGLLVEKIRQGHQHQLDVVAAKNLV